MRNQEAILQFAVIAICLLLVGCSGSQPRLQSLQEAFLEAGMLDVAKQLNVPSNFIVGLASYESGWLDDHNAKLNNLWGLTQAGGNNISLPSMQAGNQYFAKRVRPFIQNSQTVPTFFSGLKKEGYNAASPKYFSMNPRTGMLFNRILNIQKWAKACNVSF